MRTRRHKIFASVAGFAIVVAGMIVLAAHRPSLPIKHIALDTDPRDQPVYQWAFGYDEATLGVRNDATGIKAVSLNQETHILIPLPALSKALTVLRPVVGNGTHQPPSAVSDVALLPSPDNRWVLMICAPSDMSHVKPQDSSHRTVYAVRADGQQTVSMTTANPESQIAWLSDSRRWAEVTRTDYILHDITAPRTFVRLPVKVLATPQAPITTLYDPKTPEAGILLLPAGGWVNTYWSPDYSGSGKPAIFWRATVEASDVVVRPVGVVTPPKDMADVQIELSPKGDQVAWTASRTPPHAPASVVKVLALVPPVQRLLAPLVSPPDQSVVWVTRLDGSDMRQISAEPCIGGQVPAYNPYDWSTDGKRFLFAETKSGKPYAMPVP